MEVFNEKSLIINNNEMDDSEDLTYQKEDDKPELKLVNYSDLLKQDQLDLSVDDIKEEARMKARLLIEEVLECSHPALLADFLNDRAYKADRFTPVDIVYKNLILDIPELETIDPRSLILLNYAKILQILKDVEMKSPEWEKFNKEREILSIEIPD